MNLYWIRHQDHTDMFHQGYIGVSKNVEKRWYDHKTYTENAHLKNAITKYGWDNLVKEVVLIADDDYCLDIEAKLRPTDQLGWNIVKGGGMPPSSLGKKFGPMSNETKAKVSASKKGHRHTPEIEALVTQNLLVYGMSTRFKKGNVSWNKGGKMPLHVIEAVRNAHLGKKLTEEHKAKISKGNMGRKMNDYTKEQLRIANANRPAAMKGKHFPKIKCSYCDKMGGIIPMKRWHMDNCKFKEQQ
jgi:group I intron endonuclease